MKLTLAFLGVAASAAVVPGTIAFKEGTAYTGVAIDDGCAANALHDQVETVTIDSVTDRFVTATVAYKPLHSGSWTMRDGVHVECWHYAGTWDATPIISKKDSAIGYGYGQGSGPARSHTFTFEVKSSLDVEQHYIRCGIIDLSSKYDRFDRDTHCAHRYAGRSSAHHFDNVDAPFSVHPGLDLATNKCTFTGSKYGGVLLPQEVTMGLTKSECLDAAESKHRSNADGSTQVVFQDHGSKKSVHRAFGRRGVRCLFKFINCPASSRSPLFRSALAVANDRSTGWDTLPQDKEQCAATVGKMADACGPNAVVLARPEAGVMCNQHNHGQDWCQGDKTSPVPKMPFEAGYTVPDTRNPGTNCYGAGCASYNGGQQICKHFKCKYTKGKTTVFGFMASHEKYHCARNGPTSCECTCHEENTCRICHDTPDFALDAHTHHSRTPAVCRDHCPKPTAAPAAKNCAIRFSAGCPNEFDHSRAVQDSNLREKGLVQFTDQFKNHYEHAVSEAACHGRATELRKQCFYHPKDTVGYGSVFARYTPSGVEKADQWRQVCGIKFHNGCPAMERKYGVNMWKSKDPERWMYKDHTESPGIHFNHLPETEEECLERSTDFRKQCFQKEIDGEGKITSLWLDTSAQRTDAWEGVCGLTANTCPTLLREYGAVPESHTTHITRESVMVQIRPTNPEVYGARVGKTIIDTSLLNVDSTDAGSRHPDSNMMETRHPDGADHDHENWEVIETVSQLTMRTCLNKARETHEDCFSGTEAGAVRAYWIPTKTEEVVTESKDKTVYFKKTAAQLNGQTACSISFDTTGVSCPRAEAQNKVIGWDQKNHVEWTHNTKDECLARALEIYDFCFFWPGSDDTLNHYINKQDKYVGRPDQFYPGSVTATWAGDKNQYGEFTNGGAVSETVRSSEFNTIKHGGVAVKPHHDDHDEHGEIAHAIYDKDANQNFQTAEADRTMGYTTPNSRTVEHADHEVSL